MTSALVEWTAIAGICRLTLASPRRAYILATSCFAMLITKRWWRQLLVSLSGSSSGVHRVHSAVQERVRAEFSQFISQNDGDGCGILLVDGPTGRFEFEIGTLSSFSRAFASPETRFEIASVTKMMVAYVVLKLEKCKRIDLDAPVTDYVKLDDVGAVTVRHLLTHTSGLADFWSDGPEYDLATLAKELQDRRPSLLANPLSALWYSFALTWFGRSMKTNKFSFYSIVVPILLRREFDKIWDPRDVLRIAFRDYHAAPPGTYHYADTNYLILGLLLEGVYKKSLQDVLKQEVFAPLKMLDTYVRFRSVDGIDHGVGDCQLSSRYRRKGKWNWGRCFCWTFPDYTLAPLPFLTIPANYISADWASGGVVSTARDLCTFMRAIVHDKDYWEALLASTYSSTSSYGFGVKRLGDDTSVRVGHSGNGGACLYYWPHEDVVFAGTTNNNISNLGGFVARLIDSGSALACLPSP